MFCHHHHFCHYCHHPCLCCCFYDDYDDNYDNDDNDGGDGDGFLNVICQKLACLDITSHIVSSLMNFPYCYDYF